MIIIEIRKELKSGIIELAVIALLKNRAMYGYELSQMIYDITDNYIEVKEGTLYPILYRLEEKDVIESYWQAPEGRGKPRKYYTVTKKGNKYFDDYKNEWFVIESFMKKVLKDYKVGR